MIWEQSITVPPLSVEEISENLREITIFHPSPLTNNVENAPSSCDFAALVYTMDKLGQI